MNNYNTTPTEKQEKHHTPSIETPYKQASPSDALISFYEYGGKLNFTRKYRDISFSQLVDSIMNPPPALVKKTATCHRLSPPPCLAVDNPEAYDKKKNKYREYKASNLSSVTTSGTFEKDRRENENLLKHSQIICIDYDHFQTIEQVEQAFATLCKHPAVFFIFRSPSGLGLKVFIRIDTEPADNEEHKKAYVKVASEIDAACGHKHDAQPKHVNALCFIAADPRAYYNPLANPIHIPPEPVVNNPPVDKDDTEQVGSDKPPSKDDKGHDTARPSRSDKPKPVKMINRPPDNHEVNESEMVKALSYISPDCDYGTWRDVGMGLKDAGYPFHIFDGWSSSGGKYGGTDATAKQWQAFKKSGITIATVFHHACRAGYQPPARAVDKGTRRAKVKVKVDKDYQHETSDMPTAREVMTKATLGWYENTKHTKEKQILINTTAAGVGKSYLALANIENLLGIYKTTEQADQAYQASVDLGNIAERRRPRLYNINHENWENLPHGLGENERPCTQPKLCNKYARRGQSTELVCSRCPDYEVCCEVGYKSQTRREKNANHVFISWDEAPAVDSRYKEQIREIAQGKTMLLEEPAPGNITQKRKIKHAALQAIRKRFSVIDKHPEIDKHPDETPEAPPAERLIFDFIKGCEDFISIADTPAEVTNGIKQRLADFVDKLWKVTPEIQFPQVASERKRKESRRNRLRYAERRAEEHMLHAEILDDVFSQTPALDTEPDARKDEILKRIDETAPHRLEWDITRQVREIKRKAERILKTAQPFDLETERQRIKTDAQAKREKIEKETEAKAEDARPAERMEKAILYLDNKIEKYPAWRMYEQKDDGIYALIRTENKKKRAKVVGKEEHYSKACVRLDADARFEIDRWEFVFLSASQALDAELFDKADPPACYRKYFTDLMEFIKTHPNLDNAPMDFDSEKRKLNYELLPTLNTRRAIFNTASDTAELIGKCYDGTDVNVTYHKGTPPAWHDTTRFFQISTGKYSCQQAQVRTGKNGTVELDDFAVDVLENLIKPCMDGGLKTLIVAPKAWKLTEEGKKLADQDVLINHHHAEGVNDYQDRDIVFCFHYEPRPDEIERQAKTINSQDEQPLCFDRKEQNVTESGVAFKTMAYTDHRVQKIYNRECAERHRQSILRLRPNLNDGKIIVLLTSQPTPQIPVTPALFKRSDMAAFKDFAESGVDIRTAFDNFADYLKETENSNERILEMSNDGKTQADIASDIGITQPRISQVLKAEKQIISDAQYIINSETYNLKNEPAEIAKSNHRKSNHCPLSPIQKSNHRKYHKGVARQILDLLQDGQVRKTSEIINAIDAHPVKIKTTLKNLLKSEQIEKVAYGRYRKADPPPVDTEPDGSRDDKPRKDEHPAVVDKPAQPVDTERAVDNPPSKDDNRLDNPPVQSKVGSDKPVVITARSKDEQPEPVVVTRTEPVDTERAVGKQPPARKDEQTEPVVVTRTEPVGSKGYNKMNRHKKLDTDDSIFSHPPVIDTEQVDKQPPARKDDKDDKDDNGLDTTCSVDNPSKDGNPVGVAEAADEATAEFIIKKMGKSEVTTERDYQACINRLLQSGMLKIRHGKYSISTPPPVDTEVVDKGSDKPSKDDKPPAVDTARPSRSDKQPAVDNGNPERAVDNPPVFKDTVSVWIEPAGDGKARIYYGNKNRLADLRIDTVQSIPAEQAATLSNSRLEIKIDEMIKLGFEIAWDDPSLDGNPRAEADRKAYRGYK